MRLPFSPKKVNARIAAGRSVLTRTVVDRDESRAHICILRCKCSATHENSRREIYRREA